MRRLGNFVMLILFLASILLLIIIPKLWGDGAEVQQGRYVPQVLISASWGEKNLNHDGKVSKPGEFGSYTPPEGYDLGPGTGPVDFTISPSGEIYILDNLNKRVQKFSAGGNFIGIVPVIGGDDMIVDRENNIYLGAFDWTSYPKVEKYDQNGTLLITYHLGKWGNFPGDGGYRSVNHWRGSGCIYSDNLGRLYLNYAKQDRPLFPGDTIPPNTVFVFQFGTTTQEFSFEEQMSTLRIESSWGMTPNIPDGDKFFQQEIAHGSRGRNVVKLSFKDSRKGAQKGLAEETVIGREKPFGITEDAIYTVTKDEQNPKISIVRKYNQTGDLLAIYTLNWYEGACEALGTEYQEVAWVKKKMLFDKGFLYTYIHCKDGLKIIKWSPVEGGQ